MKRLEQKNLAPVDENLIKYLRAKYPPIVYKLDQQESDFLSESIFRAGQLDVIEKIESILNSQRGKGG